MKKIYLVSLVSFLCGTIQHSNAGTTGTTPADGSGNTYGYVQIGTQYWMTENLRTTKFLDGSAITDGTGFGSGTSSQWFLLLDQVNNTGTPAYSKHTDAAYVQAVDGLLYNWFAVTDAKGICPTGWRAPSNNDFKVLEMYLGMSQADADLTGVFTNLRGNDKEVGTKLKSATRDFLGTNTVGFNGIPSGNRSATGLFQGFNADMWLWTTTEFVGTPLHGYRRVLRNSEVGVSCNNVAKCAANSVRCVKDVTTSIDKISASAKAVSTKIYTISGAPVRNNMETLAKGIYVKKTVYDNGQISVEKLIKKQD